MVDNPADILGASRPQNASIDRTPLAAQHADDLRDLQLHQASLPNDVARLIIRRLSRSWWRAEEHPSTAAEGSVRGRLLVAKPTKPAPEPTLKELAVWSRNKPHPRKKSASLLGEDLLSTPPPYRDSMEPEEQAPLEERRKRATAMRPLPPAKHLCAGSTRSRTGERKA